MSRLIGPEQAELFIHEIYGKDQKKWIPNRTNEDPRYWCDRISVTDIKTEEELRPEFKESLEQRVIEV